MKLKYIKFQLHLGYISLHVVTFHCMLYLYNMQGIFLSLLTGKIGNMVQNAKIMLHRKDVQ